MAGETIPRRLLLKGAGAAGAALATGLPDGLSPLAQAQTVAPLEPAGPRVRPAEDKKGSLEPGKLADLAVLSADPLTIDEAKISETTALMTMIGGKMVHETPNWFG